MEPAVQMLDGRLGMGSRYSGMAGVRDLTRVV